MTNDPFTPAFAVFGIICALLLAVLELMVLKRTTRLADSKRDILIVAFVNVIFVYLLFASQSSYLFLFIFPIPVIPLAYLGLKGLAYRWMRRHSSTPLHWPIRMLFLSMIFHFLAFAFAYTEFDKINPTQSHLEEAIREKKNGLLDTMLWISVVAEPNMTTLMNTAIAYDNDDAVRRLIRRGADPRQNYETWKAPSETRWRIAKWRLDKGLNSAEFSQSIAEASVSRGLPELEYSLQHGLEPKDHPGILHSAFIEIEDVPSLPPEQLLDFQKKIALLLQRGAPVNGYREGITPIYRLLLSKSDLSAVLALLIENGADVNVRNETSQYLYPGGFFLPEGFTPLMLAAQNNRATCVELLLTHGAVKAAKDAAGRTALDHANKAHADRRIIEQLE